MALAIILTLLVVLAGVGVPARQEAERKTVEEGLQMAREKSDA
jgi:hypothetical protein